MKLTQDTIKQLIARLKEPKFSGGDFCGDAKVMTEFMNLLKASSEGCKPL